MKNFRTIFTFEYMGIVRTKLFIILTSVLVIGAALVLSIPPRMKSAEKPAIDLENKASKVLIVDKTGAVKDIDLFKTSFAGYDFTQENDTDVSKIKNMVNSEEYDMVFLVEDKLMPKLYQKRLDFSDMATAFGQVYSVYYRQNILEGKISKEDMNAVSTQPLVVNMETDKGRMDTYFYTYVLLMLLYMTICLYGQMVATSVASEKSSRAMELLITSSKPTPLLFGKIFGSGLAGLTQIILILGASIGFYKMNYEYWQDNQIVKAIFDMPLNIIIYTVVFFVLGFLCFAALYGALGSLVSRAEDVGMASMPVTMMFVVSFFIAIISMATPESLVSKIFSIVPFFSPCVMFVRICSSTVPFYQIMISIILSVGAIIFTSILGAKIYRLGTLTYGKTPNMKTIIELLRNDRKK